MLLESTTKSEESGTYDVICQFCTVKGMVVESEVLKVQNFALSKLSLPMHSNEGSKLFALVRYKKEVKRFPNNNPNAIRNRSERTPATDHTATPLYHGSETLTADGILYIAGSIKYFSSV